MITAFVLVFCTWSLICAEPKFTIIPKISASWQTDSNFYKSETNKRGVHTTLTQPGIEIGAETAKSMLALDYTHDIYDFDERDPVPAGTRTAENDDYNGDTLNIKIRIKPFDRLTLGLDDGFVNTRDPSNLDRFNNSVARDEYSLNRITPLVFYEFGEKFSAGLQYRNTDTDYDLGTREDSNEDRSIFDLVYNLTKKSSLDLEYHHWEMDYKLGTSDYTSEQVSLIFRNQFKYFSFEIGGGYHDRDFDQAGVQDIDGSVYRFSISGQNPPAPEPPRSYITLGSELNFNDAGVGNSYNKAHKMTLNAGYTFMEKIPVNISGSYQDTDYERTNAANIGTREDDTYTIEGSIGYMVNDWLTFTLKSGYEERDSNTPGNYYENTFGMFQVALKYNLNKK